MVEDVLVLWCPQSKSNDFDVLILVVVEDVLVQVVERAFAQTDGSVLILVVVEDVLVRLTTLTSKRFIKSLNPCCGGRCSSTELYKTKLIINKLKNST